MPIATASHSATSAALHSAAMVPQKFLAIRKTNPMVATPASDVISRIQKKFGLNASAARYVYTYRLDPINSASW